MKMLYSVSWHEVNNNETTWNLKLYNDFSSASAKYMALSFNENVVDGRLAEYKDGALLMDFVFNRYN